MTPEQYHLQNIGKIKDATREKMDELNRQIEKHRKEEAPKIVLKKLRDAGFRVPKTASIKRNQYGDVVVTAGDLVLSAARTNIVIPGEEARERERSKLYLARKFLCDNSSPTAAKRFGSFARMKYGKKVVPEVLLHKLFAQWIEHNTGCTC